MLQYPVTLTREGSDVLVSFPGIPQIHTFGSNEQDALARAVEALETYFIGSIADHSPIPDPPRPTRNKRRARWTVTLPVLSEAKVELYKQMQSAGVGKAELARRLHCHLPQIDRLLDLNHASRLDQIEQALLAVGKRLTISVEDAA
jgi:antitoxin HicB